MTRGLSLAVAVLAVTVPDLVYAGWLVAEPFAYPLVLGALAAAVAALAAPSRRAQLAFVAFAVLAAFARAQFAVLPLCFVLALVLVGLRERRLRAALREQALPLAVFGAGAFLVAVAGRDRLLGVYRAPFGDAGIPRPDVGPDLLVLAFAAGWIVVPGALLGLALAIARPRSRAELVFGALAVVVTAALVVQAAFLGDVALVQERYLFYVAPLLATGFALYAARGWPHRRAHLLLAGGLLLTSARFPLGTYTVGDGKEHSPFLMGASRLEPLLESSAAASSVVAGLAALLCLGAVLCSLRPRAGTVAAIGLAAGLGLGSWAGAVDWDTRIATNISAGQLPAEQSFADAAGVGPVAALLPVGAQRIDSIHAFWNRSLDRVLLLPGATRLDPFRNERVAVGRDGTLRAGGEPVRNALLVDEYATTIRLHDARRLTKVAFDTLWDPRGDARMELALVGRYYDGRLARSGDLDVWADRPATVVLRLTGAAEVGRTELRFQLPRGRSATTVLSPGRETVLRLPVCPGGWSAHFESSESAFVDGRVVAGTAAPPALEYHTQAIHRRCR